MSGYSTHPGHPSHPGYSAHPSAGTKGVPNWKWWIPATGISRNVITSEIQRYLGADAVVRPGLGKGENQGIDGYWISAYRNLTSAMIEDLKRETVRVQKEQQQAPVGRYQDPPHRDRPTPPPPHSSAYPPPSTGSPYTPEGAYPPPPSRAGQAQPGYQPSQPYGSTVEARYGEYASDYSSQQPPYGQPNVSPNAPHYAQPHYTPGVPTTQAATAGAYAGYPSPPPSQYPQHSFPSQSNIPRQSQYQTGAYTQATQQGFGYPTASTASSNTYPSGYQANGQYQYR